MDFHCEDWTVLTRSDQEFRFEKISATSWQKISQRCVINSTLDTFVQLQVIVSLLQGPTTLLGWINNSLLASLRSQGRCSEADYISK